uniref:Ig-like domain-containing protein n=1 Tax=Scylla olivacea TaxID=85551 RepID=A0A0P4VXQ3_SCYOL
MSDRARLLIHVLVITSLIAAGRGVREPLVVRKGNPTNFLKLKLKMPVSSHCIKHRGKGYFKSVTLGQGDNVLLPCHYCGLYFMREKQWFRSQFEWQAPWDMKKKMRALGGKKSPFIFKSPLDFIGMPKKKYKKFTMTKEEERLEELRRKRQKAVAPWPTQRGFRRTFGADRPLSSLEFVREQKTLLGKIWLHHLFNGDFSGEKRKFLAKYKRMLGKLSFTKYLKKKIVKLQYKTLPRNYWLFFGQKGRQQVARLWEIWLYSSVKEPRKAVTWSSFIHKYAKQLGTSPLNNQLQIAEIILKQNADLEKAFIGALWSEDAPSHGPSDAGQERMADDGGDMNKQHMEASSWSVVEDVLQQRILHRDFHRVINSTYQPLVESYKEKLAKYKSGKKPEPPDGFLEQSLHFTWNAENKVKAKEIQLEELLFSISAGNLDKVKELASKISSTKRLRDSAKSLRVSHLVRTIGTGALSMEETQQATVKVYDVRKMLDMAAQKAQYEAVMQHLLGVFTVHAWDYNFLRQLSLVQTRQRLLQLSDESLVLYRANTGDTGLYTCSSGFSEDFGPSSFTYYLEVLETRGHFPLTEGNQDNYEAYKTKVVSEYNKVLRQYWQQDNALLNNTEFYVYEGDECECSGCSGKVGVKKTDIQLRIVKTEHELDKKSKLKNKFKFKKLTSGKKTRRDEKAEPKGVHIRSPDVRRLAPTFHRDAAHKIEEFLLVTPCIGTRPCLNEIESLVPEKFGRQPLSYVHEAVEGHPVKLRCPTRHPEQVIWYHNNKPLVPTKRVFITKAQVGITSLNANTTGNYSCVVEATRDGKTTIIPQGFVYLKLSTSMGEIHFYMALFDLAVLVLLLVVIMVPITCITPAHNWYKAEAKRYSLMTNTIYRVQRGMENLGQTGEFREARKIQRLRAIVKVIESRNICDMVGLQNQLVREMSTKRDEEEWLSLLSSEIWKLQNTTGSQAVLRAAQTHTAK